MKDARREDGEQTNPNDAGPAAEPEASAEEEAAAAAAAVRRTDELLAEAMRLEVTALAFTPLAGGARISHLRGERWEAVRTLDALAAKRVGLRLKVLAGLDLTERRLPQRGTLDHVAGGLRCFGSVSVLPAHGGDAIHVEIGPPRVAPAGRATARSENAVMLGIRRASEDEWATLAGDAASALAATGLILIVGSDSDLRTAFAALARDVARSGARGVLIGAPDGLAEGCLPEVALDAVPDFDLAWAVQAARRLDFDVYIIYLTEEATAAGGAAAALPGVLELALDRKRVFCGLHADDAAAAGPLLERLGVDPRLAIEGVAGMVSARDLVATLALPGA